MEKTEAVAALGDIETTQSNTRARAQHKGADVIYAIWGCIWFVAFSCQHFGKEFTFHIGSTHFEGGGLVWTPLVLLGIALSIIIARRRGAVKDKNGWKFGVLWPIVFGYFYLWMFFLGPLVRYDQFGSADGLMRTTAIASTIPMCIYVLSGIMGGEAFIAWIGGIITILTAVGFYVFPDFFYLWMAIVGGGGLLMAGYISRRKWKMA